MSDSDESGITYTEVSSPYEDLSDIGSPRADDHEFLELPYIPEDPYVEAALQAPPSPDYVPGPEEPEQAPPSPDYVPGPEHADDEIVAEDQPYAEEASPTAQSPDYVPETDPEADPEEDDDEDPEEDPIDYPADGGDDGDDEMDIIVEEEIGSYAEEKIRFRDNESAATHHHTLANRVKKDFYSDQSTTPGRQNARLPLTPRIEVSITLGLDRGLREAHLLLLLGPARGLRADYGFVATMDRERSGWLISRETFETRVRQDTDEIYTRLDDEQSQMLEIRELHAADRRRQAVTSEMLKADLEEICRDVSNRGPAQPELPEEAGRSS
ncbi:hypothetical protein Tco_0646469 [Tanacetum coccineum]